jgi:hypothetical protein
MAGASRFHDGHLGSWPGASASAISSARPLGAKRVRTKNDICGNWTSAFHNELEDGWLPIPDHSLGCWLDAIEVFLPVLLPSLFSSADRKLRMSALCVVAVYCPYQAAYEVIHGRAHIEHTLAEQHTQSDRQRILSVMDEPRFPPVRLQYEVSLDTLEPITRFGMQRLAVFVCPCHLGINAVHPRQGIRKWHMPIFATYFGCGSSSRAI